MITMITLEFRGGLYVRFNIPKNGKVVYEFSTAKNLAEAKKMMYFRNRNYIYQKLHAWLIQRSHALAPLSEDEEYAQKIATIEELKIHLDHLQNSWFWILCAFVCRKKNDFLLIAPVKNSRHYKHYSRAILPIINFCVEMKGTSE